MRLPVFGRDHRIVAVFLLLFVSGGLLLTGSAVANHTNGNPASGDVTVTVTNAVDEPIQGATVNITRYDDLEGTTNSNGEYTLTDVPYEDQTLKVSHPDYENVSRSVSVSTTNSPVTESFELTRTTGTISGTAVSSTGEITGNIPGANIEIEHTDSGDQALIDGTDLSDTDTTDSNGDYAIEVPTGEIELTATQDGFEENTTTSITITEDSTTTVDPEMVEILTTVDGYVRNTDGDPIRNANVEVVNYNNNIWPNLGSLTNTTTDSGYYEIEHVPGNRDEATRTLEASVQNFETGTESVELTDTDKSQSFELKHSDVSLQGTVEQTVDGGSNVPLNDITVEVDDGSTYSTTTGPNGEYSFGDLPFGTHQVTVDHPDYEAETTEVEIKQGESENESFTLTRTASVEFGIGNVSPGFWQSGDEVTVDVSFNEEVTDTVDLTVEGPTDDPQTIASQTFDTGFSNDYDDQLTFTVPENIKDGPYTVELSALGSTTSRSFTVSNVFDTEGVSFSETEYYSPAGDFVEVSVSTGNLGDTYVLIGGDRDADGNNRENYFDILHVSGGGSFIINTRLVGTDRPSEDVYIPVGGSVTSYAHDLGAANEPNGTFEGISFEDESGNQVASTLAGFRNEIEQSPRGSPLQVGRYQLVAGATGTVVERDGAPDFRHPAARSNLVLTQPTVGNVTTYTLPPGPADQPDQFSEGSGGVDIGSLLSEATETDRITRGDRILIEVQSSGMYGALFDQQASNHAAVGDGGGSIENIPPGMMKQLLDRSEGVRFELADSELAAPNHPGADLRFTDVKSSDLYILPDSTADQWNNTDALGSDPILGGFYVIIDTRGDDPFNGRPQDGDKLTVDFAYESPPDSRYQFKDYSLVAGEQPAPFDPAVEPVDGVEHFPYFGSSTTTMSVNDSFVFEDPFINYDETTLDGELIVGAESDGFIRGQTNLAPGSQVQIQLVASNRPDPKLITIEDVEIDEDRAFDVTADFSELTPGDRVEVEFYTRGRLVENQLIDKRGVRVVENLDNPATFEIDNLTDSVTVQRGQQLGDIEATIVNTGDIADRQLVEVTIDGRTVRNQTIVLNSDEETTLSLSEQFVVLSPGEYTYTVRTEDDEQSGQLTVTGSENTEISSVESTDPTVNERPGENNDDQDPPGLFGMIGLQRRDVAVAAAVTGAMHVLGQWT